MPKLTAPPSTFIHRNDHINGNRAAMRIARNAALDTGMNRHKRRTEGKKLGIRGTPTADAIRERQHQKEHQARAEAQQRKADLEADREARLREDLAREDEAYFKKHGFYPVRHR